MPIGDVTIYECDECGQRTDKPTGWQLVHRADGSMRVTCEGASCNDRRLARAMEVEVARLSYIDARKRYHALLVEQGHIGPSDPLPEERPQVVEAAADEPISADETT
jgi:hypothetical protein